MPITLTNPISGPVVTRKEVIAFAVNLQQGTVAITFADMTDDGETVGTSNAGASLYTPAGTPRFTGPEYASIKALVYRIALEDGLVAGTVG